MVQYRPGPGRAQVLRHDFAARARLVSVTPGLHERAFTPGGRRTQAVTHSGMITPSFGLSASVRGGPYQARMITAEVRETFAHGRS